MEIRPVGIVKDAGAIEIRGGELSFLQQRPTLALTKNGRGFGGIVHEDLDARHEGGVEHALQRQRAGNRQQNRRNQGDDGEKADRAHVQARRRLAAPPDPVKAPRLDQHHREQDADEDAVDDKQRQHAVVGRRNRAEFRDDQKRGQSAADGADHDDRTEPAAKRRPAFRLWRRSRISGQGHGACIGSARAACN